MHVCYDLKALPTPITYTNYHVGHAMLRAALGSGAVMPRIRGRCSLVAARPAATPTSGTGSPKPKPDGNGAPPLAVAPPPPAVAVPAVLAVSI